VTFLLPSLLYVVVVSQATTSRRLAFRGAAHWGQLWVHLSKKQQRDTETCALGKVTVHFILCSIYVAVQFYRWCKKFPFVFRSGRV